MGFLSGIVGAIFGGSSSTTVTQTATQAQNIEFSPNIDVDNQFSPTNIIDTEEFAEAINKFATQYQMESDESQKLLAIGMIADHPELFPELQEKAEEKTEVKKEPFSPLILIALIGGFYILKKGK